MIVPINVLLLILLASVVIWFLRAKPQPVPLPLIDLPQLKEGDKVTAAVPLVLQYLDKDLTCGTITVVHDDRTALVHFPSVDLITRVENLHLYLPPPVHIRSATDIRSVLARGGYDARAWKPLQQQALSDWCLKHIRGGPPTYATLLEAVASTRNLDREAVTGLDGEALFGVSWGFLRSALAINDATYTVDL